MSVPAYVRAPSFVARSSKSTATAFSRLEHVQEVEGDAVFALGPDRTIGPPARLLDLLDQAFVAFKRRQRELQEDESCGCRAGSDVILAHRLLENGVGRRAYLLLTEAALRWIGLDATEPDLAVHVERYDHIGEVRCFVRDFGAAPAVNAA